MPPKGGPPLHVHEREDELFYVVEGHYLFQCGDQSVQVSQGGLVYLPKGIPHGFRNIGSTPGVLLNTITPGGFEQFFAEIDELPKDQPLDREKVNAIAAEYGPSFVKGN
jgi:mannose-6-phosphate isomerase-like protein (cupin superfamily)